MNHKTWILGCTATAVAAMVGLTTPASATPAAAHAPNGSKAAFFTGGVGTASWVNGNDPLVTNDRDGKVMQLSSPDEISWAGFQGHAIDGLPIADITALSYDFQVTTSGWTGGGGGSPRLVVEFDNSQIIALNPVDVLTTGTWIHMNAFTGAVDSNGPCGYQYQVSWTIASACNPEAKVLDAYLVNDSGWIAPLALQLDNLTLNGVVYSKPGSSKL